MSEEYLLRVGLCSQFLNLELKLFILCSINVQDLFTGFQRFQCMASGHTPPPELVIQFFKHI